MTDRIHTALLAIIAVGVTVLAASSLMPTAHATTGAVTCETYYFDYAGSVKKSADNLETFAGALEGRLNDQIAGKRVVFHSATGLYRLAALEAVGHVVCYADS